MKKIGFFTAVDYGNSVKSNFQFALEKVDAYFYLGGRKARVVESKATEPNQQVYIVNESAPWLTTALKVASYFTLVLPIIMLAAKAVLRSQECFYEVTALPLTPLQKTVEDKLTTAVGEVKKDILKTIIESSAMSPQQFLDTHVTGKLALLEQMDDRTKSFFQMMVSAIYEEVKKVPTLLQSMQVMAYLLEDSQLPLKIIQARAFPIIQELSKDLDKLNTTIIDDIINS